MRWFTICFRLRTESGALTARLAVQVRASSRSIVWPAAISYERNCSIHVFERLFPDIPPETRVMLPRLGSLLCGMDYW